MSLALNAMKWIVDTLIGKIKADGTARSAQRVRRYAVCYTTHTALISKLEFWFSALRLAHQIQS